MKGEWRGRLAKSPGAMALQNFQEATEGEDSRWRGEDMLRLLWYRNLKPLTSRR